MPKYYLDSDLRYKRIRKTFKQKLIRIFLFLVVSIFVSIIYHTIYFHYRGSAKEQILEKQLQEVKFNYTLLHREFDEKLSGVKRIESSDEIYRSILNLGKFNYTEYDIPIEEYESFNYFAYPEIIVPVYKKLDTLNYLISKEESSYYELEKETQLWLHKIEHLPYITPVNIVIERGDGIMLREKHPILGRPAWHHGQDFSTPMGTPVYATGAGKVIYVGVDKGLGNFVKIDHGYGYQTIYGHLSEFKVKRNQEVKRGDLIALSGNTGYSTGPHLHYEIHLYGKYQNPLHFFEDDMDEEEYIAMINTLNELFRKGDYF